jgi:hypothetical protein
LTAVARIAIAVEMPLVVMVFAMVEMVGKAEMVPGFGAVEPWLVQTL